MNYGRKDYTPEKLASIPADEPVFLIRAQDALSYAMVLRCARVAEQDGGNPELAAQIKAHADVMNGWKNKKQPDVPADAMGYPGAKRFSDSPKPKPSPTQGGSVVPEK